MYNSLYIIYTFTFKYIIVMINGVFNRPSLIVSRITNNSAVRGRVKHHHIVKRIQITIKNKHRNGLSANTIYYHTLFTNEKKSINFIQCFCINLKIFVYQHFLLLLVVEHYFVRLKAFVMSLLHLLV